MHKLGMTAPNDGSSASALLEMPFGSHLVIHDGAGSLSFVEEVRRRYGHDVLIIVRFNHRISDPTQDIVDDFVRWVPAYNEKNGGTRNSLLFTWENEPDGDEGGHTPEYVRDRLIEVNLAIRRAVSGVVALAGPNFAKMSWYDARVLDSWIDNGEYRYNVGLRNALFTFDLLLVHGYGDPHIVQAYVNAIENPHIATPDGQLVPNVLAEMRWGFSEFSAHRADWLNDRAARTTWDFARALYDARYPGKADNNIVCGIFFIWSWGGYDHRQENIVDDEFTIGGLIEGLRSLPQVLTPIFPKPLSPLPPEPEPPIPPIVNPDPVVPRPGTEYYMEPMRKRMMVWNPNGLRERSAADWSETLHEHGDMDALSIKWWQRDYFMDVVSGHRHPLVPATLADARRIHEEFKAQGIVHIPWGVPMGHDWRAEADFAAAIARVCDGMIEIDLEPYGRDTPTTGDDFWVGDWANIPLFFARLKDQGATYVICNFDAREFGWKMLHLAEIAPYVDHFCTQSYDVGFNVPFRPLYDRAVNVLREVGAKSMGIVGDARAGLGIADRALYAQQLGCNELACWAGDAGMATLATYQGFAAFPLQPYLALVEGGVAPTPIDVNAEWGRAHAVAQEVVATAQRVEVITTPGLLSFEEPDGTVVDLTDEGFVIGALGQLITQIRTQADQLEQTYVTLVSTQR